MHELVEIGFCLLTSSDRGGMSVRASCEASTVEPNM